MKGLDYNIDFTNSNVRRNVKNNFPKIDYVFNDIIQATNHFLQLQKK